MPTARELLDQADALMRRNRAAAVDDIPVLTDSVGEATLQHLVEEDMVSAPVSGDAIPTLTERVGSSGVISADVVMVEGEPSDWLDFDEVQPSVIGEAPDSIAIVPPVDLVEDLDEAVFESAEHEEIEITSAVEEDFDEEFAALAESSALPAPEPASPSMTSDARQVDATPTWEMAPPSPDATPVSEMARLPESTPSTLTTPEAAMPSAAALAAAVDAAVPTHVLPQSAESVKSAMTPAMPDPSAAAPPDSMPPAAFATSRDFATPHSFDTPQAFETPPAVATPPITERAPISALLSGSPPVFESSPDTELLPVSALLPVSEAPTPYEPPADSESLPDSESPRDSASALAAELAITAASEPPYAPEADAPPIDASPAPESVFAPEPEVSAASATPSGPWDDQARWDVAAEEIRMQVLQRIDLFTDTGLREQLGMRLKPIVDRASADLVATINQHVGELLRSYVAEAIEREIERWREQH